MSRPPAAPLSWLDRIQQGHWTQLGGIAVFTFLFGYVLLPKWLGVGSSLAFLPRVAGVLCSFGFATLAIYRLLQARSSEPDLNEITVMDSDPLPLQLANARLAIAEAAPGERPRVQPPLPTNWKAWILEELDERHFSALCSHFFAAKGLRVERTPGAAGHGADLLLWRDPNSAAEAVADALVRIRCQVVPVAEEALHDLLNAAAAAHIEASFFIAPAGFDAAAREFAQARLITLLDSKLLVAMIQRLEEAQRKRLLEFALAGLPTAAQAQH